MNGKELAAAMIASNQMDMDRAYLERGRQLQALGQDELEKMWAASFRAYFALGDQSREIELNDADAELRLRGIPIPNHLVEEETKIFEKRLDAKLKSVGREKVLTEVGLAIEEFEKKTRH
jgi:hypothetical protein